MAAEDAKPAAEAAAPAKGKNKKKLLLIVLIAVVVLGAGGGAALFLMREPAAATAEAGPAPEAVGESAGLVPLDTFLVNLHDPGGERYMKLTLRLAITPETRVDGILGDELLLARIRDRVLTVLSAKSFSELNGPLGKEGLRHEIQLQLSALVDPARVQDVLFSEFVVQ
jgi:flagellar FliL protein